jgi:hypothetical protein
LHDVNLLYWYVAALEIPIPWRIPKIPENCEGTIWLETEHFHFLLIIAKQPGGE